VLSASKGERSVGLALKGLIIKSSDGSEDSISCWQVSMRPNLCWSVRAMPSDDIQTPSRRRCLKLWADLSKLGHSEAVVVES
jgi:hypothetical protein